MNEIEDQKEIEINIENENNLDYKEKISIIPIITKLEEIGYNKIYSKRLVAYYHPQNIDEAIAYLLKEDGIIQHFYIEDRELIGDKLCFLCGEKKEIHLGFIPENINNDNIIDNDIHNINDISNNDITINELNSQRIKTEQNLFKTNDNNYTESIKKVTCGICSELFVENSSNKLQKCGHSFCNDCWYNFLSIKIKENKLGFIKCLNYECQEKLSDDFIINVLKSNKELIDKYKKYKIELDIINVKIKPLVLIQIAILMQF